MLKKALILISSLSFICLVGFVVYADTSGVFLQDNNSAAGLVDKYISFVMKSYHPDGGKVSFRGIIKQGCDFWYYNDYNIKTIINNHVAGSSLEVADTSYSIEIHSIDYSNKTYTIKATVTEKVKYKMIDEPTSVVQQHTITIEQDGGDMYIVNDDVEPKINITTLMPKVIIPQETADAPK